MKPIYAHFAGALALTFALGACVPRAPRPAPPVRTQPAPAPSPMPTPTPAPSFADWMDAPRTPGDWTYRARPGGGIAVYGEPVTEGLFSLRCDAATRALVLARAGRANAPTQMTVRTETQTRTLAAAPSGGQLSMIEARLPAGDRLLDAMALSKGRFAIETPGATTLYLPSWAEVTRVIEDCR